MNKTSIKINKNLNRDISILAILQRKKKGEFIDELLEEGLKPYKLKYERLKFR